VGAESLKKKLIRGALTFMLKTIDSAAVHAQRRSLYAIWTRDLADKPWIP
jgi:3-hydroxyacyl-[acyl-carrier-protein] dehydratase